MDNKCEWKLTGPKKGEPKTKKVGDNAYHWCHKEHGAHKKPIWALYIPEEHTGQTSNPPHKTDELTLELNDKLRSLLSIYQRYFKRTGDLAYKH